MFVRICLYMVTLDEDDSSGPYYITFAAGIIRFSFNVSILDDKILEEHENFILTIDPSSLPCSAIMIRLLSLY